MHMCIFRSKSLISRKSANLLGYLGGGSLIPFWPLSGAGSRPRAVRLIQGWAPELLIWPRGEGVKAFHWPHQWPKRHLQVWDDVTHRCQLLCVKNIPVPASMLRFSLGSVRLAPGIYYSTAYIVAARSCPTTGSMT